MLQMTSTWSLGASWMMPITSIGSFGASWMTTMTSIQDDTNDSKIHFRQSSVTFSICLPVFIAVTRNTFPVWHFWISIIVICTLVAPGSSIFIITFTNWLVVNFVKVASVSERMSRGFGVWTGTSLARYVIWWRGGTIKTFPTNKGWVLKDHTVFLQLWISKKFIFFNLDKRYYDEMTIFYYWFFL